MVGTLGHCLFQLLQFCLFWHKQVLVAAVAGEKYVHTAVYSANTLAH